MTNWDNIIRQIKSEVNFRIGKNPTQEENGLVSVRLISILDCNGNPIAWTVESKKIYPNAKAKQILTDDMAQHLLETY